MRYYAVLALLCLLKGVQTHFERRYCIILVKVLEPVDVGDVTSRRRLLRGIEIFYIYHSHQ